MTVPPDSAPTVSNETPSSTEDPWFITWAFEALDEGQRVIVDGLNSVMAHRAIGIEISASELRNGDSLQHAVAIFKRANDALNANYPMTPCEDDEIAPWTLGYINERTDDGRHKPFDVTLAGIKWSGWSFDLEPHLKFLREKNTHWQTQEWVENIQRPVEERYALSRREIQDIAESVAASDGVDARRATSKNPTSGGVPNREQTPEGEIATQKGVSLQDAARRIRSGDASQKEEKEFENKLSVEARAIAHLIDNGFSTKKDIAEAIGCHEKSLASKRCPKFNALWTMHQAQGSVPKGTKQADGRVEAIDTR